MALPTYTPANAIEQGDFPLGLTSPLGLTWDGQHSDDKLLTVPRETCGEG